MSNKITIARALVELKSLKGRIERAGSLPIAGITIGLGEYQKPQNSEFSDLTALSKTIQGNFDSIQALLRRREAVKRALVKANAETVVDIANKKYTLAEAIELKTFVNSRKALLANMSRQLRAAVQAIQTMENQMEERVDGRRAEMVGASEDALKATVDNIRNRNTPTLITHQNLSEFIITQMKEVEDFEQEVDVALNEANAKTEIVVDE